MGPEKDYAPCEIYIDGEPAEGDRPMLEITELELAIAVRYAKVWKPTLANRYLHAKKKRIRKKYAKRILIWFWEMFL